jgi:hypothetical protein
MINLWASLTTVCFILNECEQNAIQSDSLFNYNLIFLRVAAAPMADGMELARLLMLWNCKNTQELVCSLASIFSLGYGLGYYNFFFRKNSCTFIRFY